MTCIWASNRCALLASMADEEDNILARDLESDFWGLLKGSGVVDGGMVVLRTGRIKTGLLKLEGTMHVGAT